MKHDITPMIDLIQDIRIQVGTVLTRALDEGHEVTKLPAEVMAIGISAHVFMDLANGVICNNISLKDKLMAFEGLNDAHHAAVKDMYLKMLAETAEPTIKN